MSPLIIDIVIQAVQSYVKVRADTTTIDVDGTESQSLTQIIAIFSFNDAHECLVIIINSAKLGVVARRGR